MSHNYRVSTVRRITLALLAVAGVMVAGSIGYVVLGFGLLDAVYQTVTTITTVRRKTTAAEFCIMFCFLAWLLCSSGCCRLLVSQRLRSHLHGG